ncbi:hypothetical protein F2Q70_00003575 [Brassica cretica]|uniref:Uncharacterized protein n=1 Tax=Brassica cretica TaxID=69181 RepID=A0A8S9IXL2_BRACR|nr:hypothetical protein F2Q70_00003575 [Brassica cretica]
MSSIDGGELVSVDETGGWLESCDEQGLLSIDEERIPLTSSPSWEIPVSACSSWLLGMCHRLGWSRTDSSTIPRMMSLGVVLKVERVPPFIVWGIVHRGSNTPSGLSTSFLPGLIGFSSDLWVFALLVEIFCPGVMDDPASRRMPPFWKDQDVFMDLGLLGRGPQSSFSG